MNPNTIFIANASEGVGFDLIRHILSQPDPPRLVFAGCTPSAAAKMKCLKNIAEEYSNLKVISLDITNDHSIHCAYSEMKMELGDGGLNLLITNAGVIDPEISGASLRDQSRLTMTQHFDMNTVAPLMMARTFLPALREAAEKRHSRPMGVGRAAIVNMSFMFQSLKTSTATLHQYHYRAARAALTTVTKLMAMELKEFGILVAAMHPGWADVGDSEANNEEERLTACHEDLVNHCWSGQ